MSARAVRHVFISSTVYDLEHERAFVRRLFERYRGPASVRFRCLVSDHPDFPVSAHERATKHSYPICIDRVSNCEYFVLLIRNRYGAANVSSPNGHISITHAEYREARRLRLPRFVFIDQRTWDAKHLFEQGRPQRFVTKKQLTVFAFLDEVRRQKGNWITFFRSKTDIGKAIRSGLLTWDDSTFVGDITIPEGRPVRGGDRFEKAWEIRNTGMVIWEGRLLCEDNSGASGLIPDSRTIPIPRVSPGETIRLSVWFTAPELPRTCESYWKMVDANGRLCFPSKQGLTCCVKVI